MKGYYTFICECGTPHLVNANSADRLLVCHHCQRPLPDVSEMTPAGKLDKNRNNLDYSSYQEQVGNIRGMEKFLAQFKEWVEREQDAVRDLPEPAPGFEYGWNITALVLEHKAEDLIAEHRDRITNGAEEA